MLAAMSDPLAWTAAIGGAVAAAACILSSRPAVGAVLSLARARAQHVKYVPVSGTDLYQRGVPLTEAQFREAFAEMRAARNRVPGPAYRDQSQEAQYQAAVKRFSVLAGTYPLDFPELSDPGRAWQWYSANDPYATAEPRRYPYRVLRSGHVDV
jgi:hypothetical protein